MSARTYTHVNMQEIDGVLVKVTTVTTIELAGSQPETFKPRIFLDSHGDLWYEQKPDLFDCLIDGLWSSGVFLGWSSAELKQAFPHLTDVTRDEDWRRNDNDDGQPSTVSLFWRRSLGWIKENHGSYED